MQGPLKLRAAGGAAGGGLHSENPRERYPEIDVDAQIARDITHKVEIRAPTLL